MTANKNPFISYKMCFYHTIRPFPDKYQPDYSMDYSHLQVEIQFQISNVTHLKLVLHFFLNWKTQTIVIAKINEHFYRKEMKDIIHQYLYYLLLMTTFGDTPGYHPEWMQEQTMRSLTVGQTSYSDKKKYSNPKNYFNNYAGGVQYVQFCTCYLLNRHTLHSASIIRNCLHQNGCNNSVTLNMLCNGHLSRITARHKWKMEPPTREPPLKFYDEITFVETHSEIEHWF